MNTDGNREFLHNSSVIARAIVFIKKEKDYTVSFIVCDLRTNKKEEASIMSVKFIRRLDTHADTKLS